MYARAANFYGLFASLCPASLLIYQDRSKRKKRIGIMSNVPHATSSEDDTPPTFFRSWLNLAKRTYKWTALPIALFVFFLGDGWTAWRVNQQGYEQTAAVVTEFTCGKSGRVEYTYTANRYPHHGVSDNPGCRRYAPGETVAVYYSTQHPELSVINAPPGHLFRKDLKLALLLALLMPPFAALAVMVMNGRRE